MLTCQHHGRYLLATGNAAVSSPGKLSDQLRPPKSRRLEGGDEGYALLTFDPSEFEYWDDSSLYIDYPLEVARSLIRGGRISSPLRPEHRRVSL